MKIIPVVSVLIWAILFTSCGGSTTTTTNVFPSVTTPLSTISPHSSTTESPLRLEKITVADSTTILDLLPLLSDRFEKIDPASEGLSNSDMGLGSEYSEVEAFLSEDPFQMIYGFYGIEESRITRAANDAMFKDEVKIKDLIVSYVMAGLEAENVNDSSIQTTITYPDIADLAVYGQGQIESSGIMVGFDIFWFKVDKVYVFFYSIYYGDDYYALDKLAREVTYRIGMYKQ
jgi:hypothetical protein